MVTRSGLFVFGVPDGPEESHSDKASLPVGIKVEVRTGFDRSWASGFRIESKTESGYQVRRRSDGELLPVEIAHDDVRRERRDSMWWY